MKILSLFLILTINYCLGQVQFEENILIDHTFGPNEPNNAINADIDNDGDLDVIFSSYDDNKIGWYENLGSNNYSNQIVINTSDEPKTFVSVKDLNNDNKLDIIFTTKNKIIWLESVDGMGIFNQENVIYFNNSSGLKITSIYLDDLDNDGDIDILASTIISSKIIWFENIDSTGSFIQSVIATNVSNPKSVHISDLDNDGYNDILTASFSDDTISWFKNDGLGGFGYKRNIATNADGATFVFTSDLDGDGDMDVLSKSEYNNHISWYENINNQDLFGPEQIIGYSNNVNFVKTGDFDNDGDIDVISGSSTQDKLALYENTDGSGNFVLSKYIGFEDTIASSNVSDSIDIIDMDNDGDIDILSTSGNKSKKRTF